MLDAHLLTTTLIPPEATPFDALKLPEPNNEAVPIILEGPTHLRSYSMDLRMMYCGGLEVGWPLS